MNPHSGPALAVCIALERLVLGSSGLELCWLAAWIGTLEPVGLGQRQGLGLSVTKLAWVHLLEGPKPAAPAAPAASAVSRLHLLGTRWTPCGSPGAPPEVGDRHGGAAPRRCGGRFGRFGWLEREVEREARGTKPKTEIIPRFQVAEGVVFLVCLRSIFSFLLLFLRVACDSGDRSLLVFKV